MSLYLDFFLALALGWAIWSRKQFRDQAEAVAQVASHLAVELRWTRREVARARDLDRLKVAIVEREKKLSVEDGE